MRYYSESQRRNYKKTLDAYGEWLKPYPWMWYGNLSFGKNYIYPEAAYRMFEDAIKDLGDEKIIYFSAIEGRRNEQRTHIHYLMNSKEKIVWKHGVSKIEPYDPQRGARFYLAKFSLSDRADLDYKLY